MRPPAGVVLTLGLSLAASPALGMEACRDLVAAVRVVDQAPGDKFALAPWTVELDVRRAMIGRLRAGRLRAVSFAPVPLREDIELLVLLRRHPDGVDEILAAEPIPPGRRPLVPPEWSADGC